MDSRKFLRVFSQIPTSWQEKVLAGLREKVKSKVREARCDCIQASLLISFTPWALQSSESFGVWSARLLSAQKPCSFLVL